MNLGSWSSLGYVELGSCYLSEAKLGSPYESSLSPLRTQELSAQRHVGPARAPRDAMRPSLGSPTLSALPTPRHSNLLTNLLSLPAPPLPAHPLRSPPLRAHH